MIYSGYKKDLIDKYHKVRNSSHEGGFNLPKSSNPLSENKIKLSQTRSLDRKLKLFVKINCLWKLVSIFGEVRCILDDLNQSSVVFLFYNSNFLNF